MISRQRATTSEASQPAKRHNQRSAKTSERSEAPQPAKRHNQRAQRSDKTSEATKLAQRQNFLLAHFLLIM